MVIENLVPDDQANKTLGKVIYISSTISVLCPADGHRNQVLPLLGGATKISLEGPGSNYFKFVCYVPTVSHSSFNSSVPTPTPPPLTLITWKP